LSKEKDVKRLAAPIDTVALLNIQGILANVLELQKEGRPEGITEPIEPIAVTDHPRYVKAPYGPWFSVILVNDGPGDVLAIVNTKKSFDQHRVLRTETYTIDMKHAVIEDVLLQCDLGGTASVRMVGVR